MDKSLNQIVVNLRVLVIIGVVVFAGLVPAMAATFTVDSALDVVDASPGDGKCETAPGNGICTLRAAIQEVNALAGADTIILPAGTYMVTIPGAGEDHAATGDLDITDNLTIIGAGADTTIIDGNRLDRVFHVDPAAAGITVEISGVTIQNGATVVISFVNAGGGGIRLGHPQTLGSPIPSGTLTLIDCVVRYNTTPRDGGGIANNAGTLILIRSTVTGNAAENGGGISNGDFGTVALTDSTLGGNLALQGGGLFSGYFDVSPSGTKVSLTNSTVSGNTVGSGPGTGFGAGIFRNRGMLLLTNSTISGNISGYAGGGIYDSGFNMQVALNNCSITGNSAGTPVAGGYGGGIRGGTVMTLRNTIVAGNTVNGSPADCSGTLTSAGYNLVQNMSGCAFAGDLTGNIMGKDAKVGIVANNGGPTQTVALQADSPAIDAGNPALPGSGGAACASLDQRGMARPQPPGGRCDIGAFEREPGFSGVSLSAVLPKRAGNTSSIQASLVLIRGNGFVSGAKVKLTRTGQTDIVGNPVTFDGSSELVTNLDLKGRATGTWDVVVTNPDGTTATLPGGFTIEEGGAPQLWSDVIGRPVLRPGFPGTFYLYYGNRGNVDAVGVSLVLAIPSNLDFGLPFRIIPPPPQAGQVPTDWSQAAFNELSSDRPGFTFIPLLLPVVPAGFTGTLKFTVTSETGVEGQPFEILFGIHPPYFKPDIDPQIVNGYIDGARAYAQQNLGVTIPVSVIPAMDRYITAQLQAEVAQGRTAWAASAGTTSDVYSVAHLVIDLAKFGAAQSALQTGLQHPSVIEPVQFAQAVQAASAKAASVRPAQLAAPRASEALQPALNPATLGFAPTATMSTAQTQPQPSGWVARVARLLESIARLIFSILLEPGEARADDCTAAGGKWTNCNGTCAQPFCCYAAGHANLCCINPQCPKPPPPNCTGDSCAPGGSGGGSFGGSIDPNDKVGTQGVSEARFLTGDEPLRYIIFFENLATATLPAQAVVITDQLDTQKLDLDTFSLGPIDYQGGNGVVPPPGLSQFTHAVDLRPGQNLIVRIDANLDKGTGIVTWRFISLDPGTLQRTQDPLAGFLPPDVHPPEGEGSVHFTVMPKTGLSTGTQIINQAQVTFDINAPINTPQWLNTIDNAKPTSRVSPLAPTQTSVSFPVQWSGTDFGAGIADYTIFVSEDGGPFSAFLTNTTQTSATFTGKTGKTYSFFSTARDLVGNVEGAHTVPDTTTVISTALPTLSALVTAKAGTQNSRVWTITLSNSGAGAAINAQIDGLTLTQTFGAACTPVVISPSSFPLPVGTIDPGGTASGNVTIDFTGCAATARFSVKIPFSANSGTVSGSKTLNNQFR